MTKYQDAESCDHLEVPDDLSSDASAHPEFYENHEVPVSGARYCGNPQKKP